jgi:uncharacterized protein (DUF433 family)
MTATAYRHIELDDKGTPVVAGTRTRLAEVVLLHLAYDWNADEIRRQQPHLSLSQIHSALAYYYDHQQEVEQDIENRRRSADEIFQRLGPSPLRVKLLAARQAKR